MKCQQICAHGLPQSGKIPLSLTLYFYFLLNILFLLISHCGITLPGSISTLLNIYHGLDLVPSIKCSVICA